jgi:hypothetical protein
VPKRMSIELVEQAGIDVGKLLELLVSNAATELAAFDCDTVLHVNLMGLEGEGFKPIVGDARIEDRNHFEPLVPRMYELDGSLPSKPGCVPRHLDLRAGTSARRAVQRDVGGSAEGGAICGAWLHADLRHDVWQEPRCIVGHPARENRIRGLVLGTSAERA